jgi:cytochrome c biogenesis protein CcmG, thiol:disulfide interchange protein DsbE
MKLYNNLFAAVLVGITALTAVSAQTAQPVQPVEEGAPAPAFTLKTIDGRTVSLADYKGKALLLHFWATWCPPCRSELPEMNKLAAHLLQEKNTQLAFLAVCVSDEKAVMAAFLKQNHYTFPGGLDSDSVIATAYNVQAIPMSVLISPAGKIERLTVGAMTKDKLADFVSAYVK